MWAAQHLDSIGRQIHQAELATAPVDLFAVNHHPVEVLFTAPHKEPGHAARDPDDIDGKRGDSKFEPLES